VNGDAGSPAGARMKTAVLDEEAVAELRAFNLSFEQRLAARHELGAHNRR
jgi:hypothetical protein